jgi:type IV pilus assembly protein PilB
MRQKLGECLVEAGLIAAADLRAALAEHKRTGEHLGVVLTRTKLATEEQIAKALASQLGFAYVELSANPPDPSAASLIAPDLARRYASVALSLEKNVVTVAMADPLLFGVIEDLESSTGRRVRPVVSTRSEILAAIESAYTDAEETQAERAASHAASPTNQRETPPALELLDRLVTGTVATHATDVHLEPTETGGVIRHRLDGVLRVMIELPLSTHEELLAQIKSRASLDVTETRLPQQGRLSVTNDDSRLHFRVTTLPTMHGEKAVLRRIAPRQAVLPLESIGMSKAALEATHQLLRLRRGLILVVGPVGSGRTTTLVSSASAIPGPSNIATIEDPIEYQIAEASQTEIGEPAGLTFARALRSVMHQDPDVVLVGELRDRETAALAIDTAASGTLVLATLRGDYAPSAVTRLAELGIERSTTASALAGVVAQRLVRQLCSHCRRRASPPLDQLRLLGIAESDAAAMVFYQATGCDQCNYTGYRGRIGVYEVMRVTEALGRVIASGSPEQICDQAIADGMVTLGEDGVAKLKAGLTTTEELLRQVPEWRERRTLCAACGVAVRADFKACPHCGARLGVCPNCGRSLEPGWSFCPYCTREVRPR